jgi:hypothetical protein
MLQTPARHPRRHPARPSALQAARAMPAKVPRRVLGATGLEVSVLGFGASPLGSVFEVRARGGREREAGGGGRHAPPLHGFSMRAAAARGAPAPAGLGSGRRAPAGASALLPADPAQQRRQRRAAARAAAARVGRLLQQRTHASLPLPHPLCPQEINEADGIAAVHEAFRLGINFFDSSPFYGGTKSETVRRAQRRRRQRRRPLGGAPARGCEARGDAPTPRFQQRPEGRAMAAQHSWWRRCCRRRRPHPLLC